MNMLKKIIIVVCFLTAALNANSQKCYTVQRDVQTKDEWLTLIDSLFREAIVDCDTFATAWLNIKVDSMGFIWSAHITHSRNMDSSFFYDICTKLEDCYSYSFLIKYYNSLSSVYKRCDSKDFMYLTQYYHYNPYCNCEP